MINDLIMKNRSYRRFDQNTFISRRELTELIDLARLSPFAGNLQSIRYMVFNGEGNNKIFGCLTWKSYLPGDNAPADGEKPSAYIVMLNDRNILNDAKINVGIAAQSILLGAVEKGYGGCLLGNIKTDQLKSNLQIPDNFDISLVIALGKPIEKVAIEPIDKKNGSVNIKYWTDENKIHHVPKYLLEDIIIN